jgi:hypothetical protein
MNIATTLLGVLPPEAQTIIISVATSSTILWLGKEWLSTRLKGAIGHEYSEKLQAHKKEMEGELKQQQSVLDGRLQEVRLQHEVIQTRTTLFFEHQVAAFAKLLEQLSLTIDTWHNSRQREIGYLPPAPLDARTKVSTLIREHQLFLDPDCQAALEIITDSYRHSLNYDDGSGAPPHAQDTEARLEDVVYLQPRIAALFQKKIGVDYDRHALRQIGLIGAIRLGAAHRANTEKWPLMRHILRADPADAVGLAEENFSQVQDFLESLAQTIGSYSELLKLKCYLKLINSEEK